MLLKPINAMIAKQQIWPALNSPESKAANIQTSHRRTMTMQPAKQDALEAIEKLPDNVDMDEIMYRLYVLDKIRKGQEAMEQGHITGSEDLKREIESW